MTTDRFLIRALGACAVAACAASSAAAKPQQQVDISGGALTASLAEFARETGAELLFDKALVSGLISKPVRGRLSTSQALSKLLRGTGIGFKQTGGSFVLFRLNSEQGSKPVVVAATDQDPPIPEILVIGRRTQNADIRRTENDIQPYKVSSHREIEAAHRSNIEEFIRARVPANAQTRTPAQDVVSGRRGNTRSAIDLRGLGQRSTLVLVDGRRLPSAIDFTIEFDQPDLNGVPLSAIERIETLTGTAGGIHGPGALGGVINVVLRRDYTGADLQVSSGVTSRGDAKRLQLEGRVGFSLNGGQTGIMLLASHQINQPQLAGERDYDVRARTLQFQNNPSELLSRRFTGNGVNVFSATGANLVFDRQLGGAPLGASFTYLPLGFEGTPAEALTLLQQNAGKLALGLSPDRDGRFRSSVSRATVTSGLVNLRHRLSDNIEFFVDGLAYRNEGSFSRGNTTVLAPTFSIAPTNPFAQPVWFTFPLPDAADITRTASDTARLTTGAIVDLPKSWSAAMDYSWGFSRTRSRTEGRQVTSSYTGAVGRGTPGPLGLPAPNPLGSWSQLLQAAAPYEVGTESFSTSRNRFNEANVRLAGPVLRVAGRPVVLSVLGQHRSEKVPESESVRDFGDNFIFVQTLPSRKQAVSSGYAELRAPLISPEAALLSGLELQIAARLDRASTDFEQEEFLSDEQSGGVTTRTTQGVNYTFGAKFYPLRRVMVRASVATGELYPTVRQLTPTRMTLSFQGTPTQTSLDPKRGNQPAGGGALVDVLSAGSPFVKPEQARTISVGAVFEPSGERGPRISIDYSRIDKRQEIVPFPLSIGSLLAVEEAFPDRITRSALTQADAARGFTAGRITEIDLTAVNEGNTIAEAVDLDLDWRMPFVRGSELQAYASITWQPRLAKRFGTGGPWVDTLGYINGASSWRGNIGAEWRRGPLAIDLNVQMFGTYRVTYAGELATRNPQVLRYQGREKVPSQAYVDLALRRRFRLVGFGGRTDDVDLRFGIQNVFDKRPPTIANPFEVPYSTYGDARRRRFELVVSTGF